MVAAAVPPPLAAVAGAPVEMATKGSIWLIEGGGLGFSTVWLDQCHENNNFRNPFSFRHGVADAQKWTNSESYRFEKQHEWQPNTPDGLGINETLEQDLWGNPK